MHLQPSNMNASGMVTIDPAVLKPTHTDGSQNHQSKHKASNKLSELIREYRLKFYNLSNDEKIKTLLMADQIKLSKKIPIKCKPVERIVPKDQHCVICYQDYNLEERVTTCKTCKNQMHSTCLINWCYESIHNTSQATCPFCRSRWKDNGVQYFVKKQDT